MALDRWQIACQRHARLGQPQTPEPLCRGNRFAECAVPVALDRVAADVALTVHAEPRPGVAEGLRTLRCSGYAGRPGPLAAKV